MIIRRQLHLWAESAYVSCIVRTADVVNLISWVVSFHIHFCNIFLFYQKCLFFSTTFDDLNFSDYFRTKRFGFGTIDKSPLSRSTNKKCTLNLLSRLSWVPTTFLMFPFHGGGKNSFWRSLSMHNALFLPFSPHRNRVTLYRSSYHLLSTPTSVHEMRPSSTVSSCVTSSLLPFFLSFFYEAKKQYDHRSKSSRTFPLAFFKCLMRKKDVYNKLNKTDSK